MLKICVFVFKQKKFMCTRLIYLCNNCLFFHVDQAFNLSECLFNFLTLTQQPYYLTYISNYYANKKNLATKQCLYSSSYLNISSNQILPEVNMFYLF